MPAFRTAKKEDIPQLIALWQQCFGDSDAFCNWFFAERWAPEYSTVAEEDGRILSAVHGWPYSLSIRGKAIPSIMMCGVATYPHARGRGLMHGCITLFMRNARKLGCMALFQKPVDFAIYRRYCHYASSDAALITKKAGACFAAASDTVDTLCSDAYAEELLPIYQSCTAAYSNRVLRTPQSMALKMRDYSADGGRLIRSVKNGRTTGYGIYYMTDSRLDAVEVMGGDGAAEDILNTLAVMAQNREFTAKFFPDRLLPDGFDAVVRPWNAMAALDVPGLMRELCGVSHIAAEIVDPNIPENNGIFAFDGIAADTAHLRLDSGRLMQLLSGYRDISALAGEGFAELLSHKADALGKLLPAPCCFTVEEY